MRHHHHNLNKSSNSNKMLSTESLGVDLSKNLTQKANKSSYRSNTCTCGGFSPSSIDAKMCRKCSIDALQANNINQKKQNSSKYKDASTSPKSSNSPLKAASYEVKSPKLEAKPERTEFVFSPKTENHYKRLSTLSVNSNTRSIGTSPKKEPNQLTPLKNDRILEKSNSLGEAKPQRLLRTTRSLSPRPPVKHQHSIMVSDENDTVTVKLSPNEEFEDASNQSKVKKVAATAKSPRKASSEHTSPNLSDYGSLKLDDSRRNANNKSTSCLVYVPSDPWTRMSAKNSPLPTAKKDLKIKKLEAKSFSKPNLDISEENEDPWIWRSNINLNEKKKKNQLKHQTKSLTTSSSKDDLVSKSLRLHQQRSLTQFEKTLTIPGFEANSEDKLRKKITRPKLQRSKTPTFYEQFFQAENENKKMEKNTSNSNLTNTKCCIDVIKCENSVISSPPKRPISSPKTESTKASLTVLNPNLLQPRHSFSTTPTQKDDELQLNIRRLSEQMKYTSSYFNANAPKFLNETGLKETQQQKITSTPSKGKVNDPLLETTC